MIFLGQQPSANDVSKLLHLPEALQRNILTFTDSLLFNSTDIPDELISTDCLSEDECNTLLNKSSKKDQIRVLVRKIKARGPQIIEKFLKIVGKDHPQVVTEVNNSLDVIVQDNKFKPVCIMCVMQSTVDLRDIGDCLWAEKIISDDVYGDIYENDCFFRNKRFIWGKIIMSLNEYDNTEKAKDILVNALRAKYNYIVEYLNENPDRQSLSCSCCIRRRTRMRPLASDFGSQTDLSMTSAIPHTVYDDLSPEDMWSETSDELPHSNSNLHSFDLLEAFESIESPRPLNGGSHDTVEKDENKRQLTQHAEQQTGTQDKNIHAEKMNIRLPIDRQTTESATSFQEKPQLAHSVSTLSTTSTLCPEQSLDQDSITFSAGTELLNQEELIRIRKSYNTGMENDCTDSGAANVNESNTLQNQERADKKVPNRLLAEKNEIEAKQENNDQVTMVTAHVIQNQVPADREIENINKHTTSLSNTKNQPQLSNANKGTDTTIERAEESKGKDWKEEFPEVEKNESQTLKQVNEVLGKDAKSFLATNMENERTADTGFGSQSIKEEENLPKDSEERSHFAPKTHTDTQIKYALDTENSLITDSSGPGANGQSNQAEIKVVTQYEFENKADGETAGLYSHSNNLDGYEDSSKETSVAAENTDAQISLSDNEITTTSDTEVSFQNVRENTKANMDDDTELE